MAVKTSGKRSSSATSGKTFATSIDIPAEARGQLNLLLNQQLADTADLHSQIKHAHWNVKGKDFYQLHLLFDELAACATEWADLIAERIAQLGGFAKGTVRMAAAASTLPEFTSSAVDGADCVRSLVTAYKNYCASTREGIEKSDGLEDPTTADLLTEVSRDADKNLWFLEAHLQA